MNSIANSINDGQDESDLDRRELHSNQCDNRDELFLYEFVALRSRGIKQLWTYI